MRRAPHLPHPVHRSSVQGRERVDTHTHTGILGDMGHRVTTADVAGTDQPFGGIAVRLERKGRRWVFGSFLLCPCHLPLTLGVLGTVLAGTSVGAVLRDHLWASGAVVSTAWVLGTAYGFRLLRSAQRAGGACPTRAASAPPAA
jgi:hypothetical protein